MKRTPFKRKIGKPIKRSRIRVKGVSDTAIIKDDIQDTLRLIVTYRDGGCVLRGIRGCGGEAEVVEGKVVSDVVIQADHLVTRANSATYADVRLVVCICKGCHGWKHWHEKEYEKLVRTVLPPERIKLWDQAEEYRQAHKTQKMDWNIELIALKSTLSKYQQL